MDVGYGPVGVERRRSGAQTREITKCETLQISAFDRNNIISMVVFMKESDFRSPYLTLNNGELFPAIGLGCAQLEDGGDIDGHIKYALDKGYRLFDTATAYQNEDILGAALRNSGYPRESYMLSSKVPNYMHGYDAAMRAFEETLKRTGMDYLDCYLIHFPRAIKGLFTETWKAMESLYEQKLVRIIGLSNFEIPHIEMLLSGCSIPPMLNQLEFNPYLQIRELRNYCREKNIAVEAWFPLGGQLVGAKGPQMARASIPLLENPEIGRVASKHGKTIAQTILRWEIQSDVVPIPKSTKTARIGENFEVFDFSLDEEDMRALNALEQDFHFGPKDYQLPIDN